MTVVDLFPAPHTTPATLTDYQRHRYVFDAPRTVPCDFCGRPAEWDCVSSGGYVVGFHAPRIKAVKDLTDDEKIAAVAAMMAAIERRRIASEAELRRLNADPTYRANIEAQRQWWRDQFARIREEQLTEERDFRSRCSDEPFPDARWHANDCRCLITGVMVRKYPEPQPVGVLPVTYLSDRGRRDGA